MSEEVVAVVEGPEDKYEQVIKYVCSKEPRMSSEMVEFLTRLDMQYSGLDPQSTLLSDAELQRTVHLDVISNKKINMLTMQLQAEFNLHILKSVEEMSEWLDGDLQRRLEAFLSSLAEDVKKSCFYGSLAEIFLRFFTLKNYILDEVTAAFETLMPKGDLKKFFNLTLQDQVETVKHLFSRAISCILIFNPDGHLSAELTGMYLALQDLQVLLTAELESDLADSSAYTVLVQDSLERHQLSGAYDVVFAESHALLALHLQLELLFADMLRLILGSRARLEILEFRADTLRSELLLDRAHNAVGDAPDSMLVNMHELGEATRDIYCEFLVVSNVNLVFQRMKAVGERIFEALTEETFQQIFSSYSNLPIEVEPHSEPQTPVASEPPLLEDLYQATWQTFDSEKPLALNGMCVVSILEDKFLKRGRLDLGVCQWNDKMYALSSPEAMDKFGKSPASYADVVHRVGHERPELILLLDLQDQFPALKPISTLRNVTHVMSCSRTSWARAERLPENERLAKAWSEWDNPRIEPRFQNKNIAAQPSNVQREQQTQCAPMVDSEIHTMSDVAVNTERPAVESPRLLSHLEFRPYWVQNDDDAEF